MTQPFAEPRPTSRTRIDHVPEVAVLRSGAADQLVLTINVDQRDEEGKRTRVIPPPGFKAAIAVAIQGVLDALTPFVADPVAELRPSGLKPAAGDVVQTQPSIIPSATGPGQVDQRAAAASEASIGDATTHVDRAPIAPSPLIPSATEVGQVDQKAATEEPDAQLA